MPCASTFPVSKHSRDPLRAWMTHHSRDVRALARFLPGLCISHHEEFLYSKHLSCPEESSHLPAKRLGRGSTPRRQQGWGLHQGGWRRDQRDGSTHTECHSHTDGSVTRVFQHNQCPHPELGQEAAAGPSSVAALSPQPQRCGDCSWLTNYMPCLDRLLCAVLLISICFPDGC